MEISTCRTPWRVLIADWRFFEENYRRVSVKIFSSNMAASLTIFSDIRGIVSPKREGLKDKYFDRFILEIYVLFKRKFIYFHIK